MMLRAELHERLPYRRVDRARAVASAPSSDHRGDSYGVHAELAEHVARNATHARASVHLPRIAYLVRADFGEGMAPLKEPIKIELEAVDGFVLLVAPALGISGCGQDEASAVKDLLGTLRSVFMSYENAAADELHESAIALKTRLQALR